MGLGLRTGVVEPLGRLAGVGQRGLEIAGHDLQPADVEPELREPPPLVVAQGPIPPLDLLDQPPLVLVAVRDAVPERQLPAQQLELVGQPQHVGMQVEHRVARLDDHDLDPSQPVQGFLQGLACRSWMQSQEREAVLDAPVERAQLGPGQLPGKDRSSAPTARRK